MTETMKSADEDIKSSYKYASYVPEGGGKHERLQ